GFFAAGAGEPPALPWGALHDREQATTKTRATEELRETIAFCRDSTMGAEAGRDVTRPSSEPCREARAGASDAPRRDVDSGLRPGRCKARSAVRCPGSVSRVPGRADLDGPIQRPRRGSLLVPRSRSLVVSSRGAVSGSALQGREGRRRRYHGLERYR